MVLRDVPCVPEGFTVQFCNEVFEPQWSPVIDIAFADHKINDLPYIFKYDRKLKAIG